MGGLLSRQASLASPKPGGSSYAQELFGSRVGVSRRTDPRLSKGQGSLHFLWKSGCEDEFAKLTAQGLALSKPWVTLAILLLIYVT